MKKYLTEGIGTFFFVATVVLAANNPGISPLAPLAIGAVYMAMIYAGAHISGAHYNPAVTLAVMMRGKIERDDALWYVVAQIVGAVLAAIIGGFLLKCGYNLDTQMHVHKSGICSVLAEFFGTFALAYVVLNVTTTRNNAGNSHYGLAIGFVVLAVTYGLGGISGGAFNPALAVGGSLAGMFGWGDIWIYLLGSLLGAAVAATVFQIVYGNED